MQNEEEFEEISKKRGRPKKLEGLSDPQVNTIKTQWT